MDSIVDLVDDIVAGVVESRKLLQNPGGVQMRRRARRFPNVVVPSAVRQGNIARDIDLPHDMRAVAQRGYMLGIRRAHHKDTKALIAHATDPDTYEIHPKIKKLARALHDDVVRRGVKAGIFKRVAHPDKRVKEKMLVPGERSSIHARQYANDAMTAHDAIDHGVTGADASWFGEIHASHLVKLHKAVTGEGSPEEKHTAVKKIRDDLPTHLSRFYAMADEPSVRG